MKTGHSYAIGACVLAASSAASAVSLDWGEVKGSFDSTLAVGTGIRLAAPSCQLINAGASGPGAPAGCLSPATSGLGDQGDLNYGKGDAFARYVKGSHELVLRFPGEVSAMARGTWVRDFAATRTTGIDSAVTQAVSPAGVGGGLTPEARDELRLKTRLLDLWVSKSFAVGDQTLRVRLGNQVLNWGESLFVPGGINATNALDVMRLSQPGAQMKEAVLAAPMLNVAGNLGEGFSAEAYVQWRWNRSEVAPVGSYWSTAHVLGKGGPAYGVADVDARNSGQWGAALRWQPPGSSLNLGAYVLNYHDKLPTLKVDQTTFASSWVYPEDRRVYGLSANFPLGDWAIGTELSYRPKDAVTLSPVAGCTTRGGRCWVDERRWQWHLTGLYSLTPANARGFLDLMGASTGTFVSEAVVVRYPHLQSVYGGDPVASGYWGWGQETDPTAAPTPGGTRNSSGIAVNFSLNYDGTLIEGWQVVPEVYWFRALQGRTPNITSVFMKGANNLNLTLTFIRNPGTWQFALNYARYSGGSSPFDKPLADRDFVGAVLSHNF